MTRSEITSSICRYAEENRLMEIDGQVIKTDTALRELLDYKEDRDLSLLHLQYYLKPHYASSD